jgi:glucose/arabinose dehydrogenase
MKLWAITLALSGLLALVVVTSTFPVPPHHNNWDLKLQRAFPYKFDGPVDLRYSLKSSDEPEEEFFEFWEDEKKELIYVAERLGRIWVFPHSDRIKDHEADEDIEDSPEKRKKGRSVFLDLSDRISVEGEMGLLGFAFHPDFPKTKKVYVSYVVRKESFIEGLEEEGEGDLFEVHHEELKKKPEIVHYISCFKVKNRLEVDPKSEKVLLAIPKPTVYHHGGSIFFGKHEHLFISVGDGKRRKEAQNPNSYLGKVLRIDLDEKKTAGKKDAGYHIPSDNPFAKGGGLPEIYALGFRNPWRCNWDEDNECIWCGDVGAKSWEEVNIVKHGRNYGWPIMEGWACWEDIHCNEHRIFELPFIAYPHPEYLDKIFNESTESAAFQLPPHSPHLPPAHYSFPFNGSAIIGGYIYHGSQVPFLRGNYIFGDYVGERLGSVAFEESVSHHDKKELKPVNIKEISSSDHLRGNGPIGFGVDSRGELYILTHGQNRPLLRFKAWPIPPPIQN